MSLYSPPESLDGADVLYYVALDSPIVPTGLCRHVVAGVPHGPFAALAICKYPDHEGYYLFYCGSDWRVITDTYWNSIEEAIDQAEFEYIGTKANWLPTDQRTA